ncbi:MAG: YdeI/OmpD-associated family protein [Candidatus Dojkabacteria bacterium]
MATSIKSTKQYPEKIFITQSDFIDWMEKNHDKEDGVWIVMYKKASGKQSINYDLALEVALCYGWIDGVSNRIDEEKYKQKFTPRREKSIWSKVNRENIARLTSEGKMKPSGIAEVDRAKADGRWDAAYDSSVTMKAPEDFLKELSKDKKAEEFYKTLSKTNLYAIHFRLQTAIKPETRANRMKILLEMLNKGEKFH